LTNRRLGFRFNSATYSQRFLDSDVIDEDGNLLDYFQRIDRFVLATKGCTFDEYLQTHKIF
jgi:hypothetical protein